MNMYPERAALSWLYLTSLVMWYRGYTLPVDLSVLLMWLAMMAVVMCVVIDVITLKFVPLDEEVRVQLTGWPMVKSLWSTTLLFPPILLLSDGWLEACISFGVWAVIALYVRMKHSL